MTVKSVVSGICLGVMAITGLASGATYQEIVIADGSYQQRRPKVSNNIVVWQVRQSDWDIKGACVTADKIVSFNVSADTYVDERNPSIDGTVVVFEWESPLGDAIMGVDLNLEALYQSKDFLIAQTYPYTDNYPVVSEKGRVLWQERIDSQWDIILSDISNRKKILVGNIGISYLDEKMPSISGYTAVWELTFLGDTDVIGVDLTDLYKIRDFNVAMTTGHETSPAVSGKWSVWLKQSVLWGDNLYDPFDKESLSSSDAKLETPALCQNVVVWSDSRGSYKNLWGYNLSTGQEFQITDSTDDDVNPSISYSKELNGYLVVWERVRNSNSDIVGVVLNGPEVQGCASPLQWDVNSDAVVDANDVNEVQSHVGETNGIQPQ